MLFTTRNEAGLISYESSTIYPNLTGPQRESRTSGKTTNAYIEFNNVDYGKHFAKAVARAVETLRRQTFIVLNS